MRGKSAFFFRERNFAPLNAGLSRLGGCHPLLLILDGAAAGLDLVVDVALDRAFGRGSNLGDACELGLIAGPAVALQKSVGFAGAAVADHPIDVGDDAADLVLSPQFCGANALRLWENRGEEAVERKEHARCHASEEHHPQHGVAHDHPHALDIRADQIAGRVQREQRNHQQAAHEYQQLIAGFGPRQIVGRRLPDVGLPGPLQYQRHQRDEEQHTNPRPEQRLQCRVGRARGTFPAQHVHAGGEAFADQPGHDQHHALDAEREHSRQQRLAGEVAHSVPSRPPGRQRQHDASGAKQR